MATPVDRTGQTFGRLTVLRRAGSDKRGNAMWHCRCSCGGETVVRGYHLRGGDIRSCGCLERENRAAGANTRHNLSDSPEYHAWYNACRRTTNPRDRWWTDYGGRGITMAPEWLGENGCEEFIAHIGLKPDPSYSLDRVDNDKGYWPGNVRWADATTQRLNQRKRGACGDCRSA